MARVLIIRVLTLKIPATIVPIPAKGFRFDQSRNMKETEYMHTTSWSFAEGSNPEPITAAKIPPMEPL